MILFGEQFARGPLCDPVTAILGGISAGTKLIGGIFGSHAASDAAKIQQQAAQQAGQKVEDAAKAVNPDIIAAGQRAGAGVTSAADKAALDAKDAATRAATGFSGAVTDANKLLDPYAQAGATASDVLNKGISAGGDFNKTPGLSDLQIDPGYQFRLDQGNKALERSAAAHGAVGSGGFIKDLTDYTQGSASQEYQKAFDRFETSTQNRFNNVNAVSREGQDAAGTQGANLIAGGRYAGDTDINATQFGGNLRFGGAQYAGNADQNAVGQTSANTLNASKAGADYLTQAANAAAAGKVASTNALWGGISGFAGGLASTYQNANDQAMFRNLFRNPAANYINSGTNGGMTQKP